jgi:hypothetical protein
VNYRYYANKGDAGPEYSRLSVTNNRRAGTVVFGGSHGCSVELDKPQVDDLIAQLCRVRGFDSPVFPGRFVSPKLETRPREIVLPGPIPGSLGLARIVVRVRDGKPELWSQSASNILWDRDRRNDGSGIWFDGSLCTPNHQTVKQHPDYLRALADVMENPTETVRVLPVRWESVEGVSGEDL